MSADIFRGLKYRSYTEISSRHYWKAKQGKGTPSKMAKALEFVFQFPPVYGVFDMGHGIVYVFGEMHENEIEDVIAHETLHFVLLRVAGKRASLKLDRIHSEVTTD
jgi:hypothetical protein